MSREITYTKVTRERFIELLERIGYKVTRQSTDGTYQLIRTPIDHKPTGYWLMRDRLEHKLNDYRGGSAFYYEDCNLKFDEDTVSIVGKINKSVFCSFHNFESQATPLTKETEKK